MWHWCIIVTIEFGTKTKFQVLSLLLQKVAKIKLVFGKSPVSKHQIGVFKKVLELLLGAAWSPKFGPHAEKEGRRFQFIHSV